MGMGMVRRWRAVRALLVIVLGVEETPAVLVVIRRSRQLGRDLAIASQGLLVCLLGRLDELALLLIHPVEAAAVLRAHVVALREAGGRVEHA